MTHSSGKSSSNKKATTREMTASIMTELRLGNPLPARAAFGAIVLDLWASMSAEIVLSLVSGPR
jgi:hypothetical protein